MRESPYQLAFEPLACRDRYGGITKKRGNLRTNLLSDLWLVRTYTEESQKDEKSSVLTCYRAFGLSRPVRRNRKKMRKLPYQVGIGPLACQERYGEIEEKSGNLRANLLSSFWLVEIATENCGIMNKRVPKKKAEICSEEKHTTEKAPQKRTL